MNQIPADFLLAVRSVMRAVVGGDQWVFHGADFDRQKAVDLCLMSEVESNTPGCYEWRAADRCPLAHFKTSTGDRAAWLNIAPKLKALCEEHDLGWSSSRIWHAITYAPVWEFMVWARRSLYQEADLVTVCKSTDPRVLHLDRFLKPT